MSRDLPAEFDLTYLRAVHAELFGEVFDWAGECRDVHLFATGTDITYCLHEEVDGRLEALFDDLAEKDWLQGLDDWAFATALAHAWAELTFIHPFRSVRPAEPRTANSAGPIWAILTRHIPPPSKSG